jgi:hypothetical protein
MKSHTFLVGNQEVLEVDECPGKCPVALKIRPAEKSSSKVQEHIRNVGQTPFALGVFNLEILYELIEDLAIGEPVEIGLSLGKASGHRGRARLPSIQQGETRIYLAGMDYLPSKPDPEPDALDDLQAENERLKQRIAELENANPTGVFKRAGAGP